MRLRPLLAGALLGALALAIPASGASAHASWLSSTPEAGATVETAPSQVRVDFDSGLLDSGAALVVTNADGVVISEPTPVIERSAISVAVDPGAPAGVYTVAFRIVSEDGHTVSDSFDYTVAGEAPSASNAPSPAVTSEAPAQPAETAAPVGSPVAQPGVDVEASAGGLPIWVWVIGVVGVVAIVIAVASGRRRS